MTDREKLIELLGLCERCNAEYCNQCEFGKDIDGCVLRKKEIIADTLLANGVTFATDTNAGSKWISVKDRLPEESDADAVGRVWAKLRTEQPRVWHWTLVVDYPEDFTHWMPLPEPPKEEPK